MRLGSKYLPVLAVLSAALLAPPVAGESALSADGERASATLDFRIRIPRVLQVFNDQHASQLPPSADASPALAAQRLSVFTNLREGFCVDLSLNNSAILGWQVRLLGEQRLLVNAAEGGYRICAQRAGRYDIALQHEFHVAAAVPQGAALHWPVQVNVVTH